MIAGRAVVVAMSLLVLGVTGVTWAGYQDLDNGLTRSDALEGEGGGGKSVNGDTNILIMGLDSRLDQNGNPLPPEVYDALHAGDASKGGYNANVLMLIHIPGDGSKATGISIPRDDYVDFPTKPSGISKGKIKQAYGYAKNQEWNRLYTQGVRDRAELEQRSRDAGRRAEVATVREFLGGIPVDHFVEVTLGGFYDLAQVVAPITVCLNKATADSYSGADFRQGEQELNAAQAVAFVRQRRDTKYKDVVLTDLDRGRRQQAFLSAVGHKLKQAGTLADPSKVAGLIDVAKKAVVIDKGLDLVSFAGTAAALGGGNISFATLPIRGYDKVHGEDVNIVDVNEVRATVRQLLSPPGPAAQTPAPPPAPKPAVEIVNTTTKNGLAGTLSAALKARGYPETSPSTEKGSRRDSAVYYGKGAAASGAELAALLGNLPSKEDDGLGDGRLRVVIGSSFTMPAGLSGPADTPAPQVKEPDLLPGGQVACVN